MSFSIPHRRLSILFQVILFTAMIIALWEQQWLNAFTTFGIIIVTLTPLIMQNRFDVVIPPTFELLAITFVFASLFLGEVQGYYSRFWWWDLALHTSSGFLLGITGFLMVYILNETERIDLNMKPGFVAFFAYLFAVGMGVLWEIFEFSMDQLFGMNMQNEMLGDPSGLTDTMWDLIVDSLGALAISILGYGYLKSKQKDSFLVRWIHAFIKSNPRLFRHHHIHKTEDSGKG